MTRGLNLLTRRTALGVSLGAVATIACGRSPLAAGSTERADLEAVFAESGVAGTFVLYDVGADHLTLVNGKRAETRLQALDLMADGRLTNPQLHTRFGEAEMARHASNARNALSGRWDLAMPRS